MRILLHIILISCMVCFWACNPDKRRAKKFLKANPNACELSQFIDHYAASGEHNKRAAAYFLVANILGKGTAGLLTDMDAVNTDSLIKQTETAFEVWSETPWKDDYPMHYFHQYVLPYRMSYEPLEYCWREALPRMFDATDWDKGVIELTKTLLLRADFKTNVLTGGRALQDFATNAVYRGGTCDDKCVFTAMLMRSYGIPTSIDYVPVWGDRNNGHSFNSIIFPDGTSHGYNAPEDLVTGELKYSGKIPKIYRFSYEIRCDCPLYARRDKEYIPPLFRNFDLEDVTDDFDIYTGSITVPLGATHTKSEFVYAAVFNRPEWSPVACGKIHDNTVTFDCLGTGYGKHDEINKDTEQVGEGILYLPVVFDSETAKPINYPFILHHEREPHYLVPDTNRLETIVLRRKYPKFGRIVNFAKMMVDGCFEGAYTPDFRNAEVLHYINQTPLGRMQDILVDNPKAYRYVRYYRSGRGFSIGELEFYDAFDNVIKGKVIAHESIVGELELSNIFDGDILTYFERYMRNLWVGIDIGAPMKITRISLCPRTDGNDIAPGDMYELLYWDGKWISLGQRVADSFELVFKGVPSGALLWLRDLSKGIEERPFTFENGSQIWW